MTIDRMVQEKADAYRNNPAALQKNYQMNQDLLDLLALQKIKSEKDAAARELQMSMEQNPQTIAEQRGVEAVDRTKDDLVKQVGGVAAQRQRQQQQNIQRAAAGAPPARQQMTGVAGQPAPNMRMQSGGIVSFAGPDGSEVKAKTPKELLEEAGYTPERFAALSEEEKQNVLQTINAKRGATRLASDVGAPFAAAVDMAGFVPRMVADAADVGARALGLRDAAAEPFIETKTPAYDALRRIDQRNQPVDMSRLQPPVNTASMVAQDMRQPNAMGGRPPAGTGGLPDNLPPLGPDPFAPAGAPTIDRATKVSEAGLPAAGKVAFQRMPEMARVRTDQEAQSDFLKKMQEQDPALARQEQRDSAAQFFDRSGIASKYGDMQRRQRELSERGAASRKDNRFYDLLSRAGGQGALANIGRAASDMRRGDRMQDQLDLANELAIEEKGLAADIDVAKSSLASGDKAAELTSAEKRTAAKGRSDLLNNQATNLTQEALGVLKADIANIGEVAARRRDMITVRTANMSAQVKENIANFNGKITTDTNNVRRLVAKVSSASDINTALGRINSSMAGIKANVAEQLTDKLASDTNYLALQAEDLKNMKDGKPTNNAAKYRAQLQKLYDDIAQNAINELQGQREVLAGKYSALTADIGNTSLGQTRTISPSP